MAFHRTVWLAVVDTLIGYAWIIHNVPFDLLLHYQILIKTVAAAKIVSLAALGLIVEIKWVLTLGATFSALLGSMIGTLMSLMIEARFATMIGVVCTFTFGVVIPLADVILCKVVKIRIGSESFGCRIQIF